MIMPVKQRMIGINNIRANRRQASDRGTGCLLTRNHASNLAGCWIRTSASARMVFRVTCRANCRRRRRIMGTSQSGDTSALLITSTTSCATSFTCINRITRTLSVQVSSTFSADSPRIWVPPTRARWSRKSNVTTSWRPCTQTNGVTAAGCRLEAQRLNNFITTRLTCFLRPDSTRIVRSAAPAMCSMAAMTALSVGVLSLTFWGQETRSAQPCKGRVPAFRLHLHSDGVRSQGLAALLANWPVDVLVKSLSRGLFTHRRGSSLQRHISGTLVPIITQIVGSARDGFVTFARVASQVQSPL